MRALVYRGPSKIQLEEMPVPARRVPTDAVVRMERTTLCGTDLPPVAGGRLANLGLHGTGPTLHLETRRSRNITLTTGLVDAVTTPRLLRPQQLVTHHFKLAEVVPAYDTFGHAARERALKVILTND